MKLVVVALLGGLAGFAGSFIPWGSPERLHGIGMPLATVLWEAPNGTLIDYPNPSAYIINPVLLSLLGCAIFGCVCFASKMIRRIRNGK